MNFSAFAFAFIILVLATGCYEPRSGCLDIQAVNFDASADMACVNSCCNYPALQLQFEHFIGAERFSEKPTLSDVAGNPYILEQFDIIISEIALIDTNGDLFFVSDSVGIRLSPTDSVRMVDDFNQISEGAFNYTIGTFIQPKLYAGIHFRIGLSAPANQSQPLLWPELHPLATTGLFDADAGTYHIGSLMWKFPDTPDEQYTQVWGGPTNSAIVELPFSTPFEAVAGFNVVSNIKLDHSKWLQGANVLTDSPATLQTILLNNAPAVFGL